jgi:electron transfer flavoprotein beta subunit
MKAKKKPIEKLQPSDLGVDVTPILETIKITEPQKRVGGTKVCGLSPSLNVIHRLNHVFKVESVDELVAKLKAAGITAV